MDYFTDLQSELIKELNTGIEGEICAFANDKKTSGLVFLERVRHEKKNLNKFYFHVLFWSHKSGKGLAGTGREEAGGGPTAPGHLCYPIIFRRPDRSPVKLDSSIRIEGVELGLNSASSAFFVCFGSQIFCKWRNMIIWSFREF